MQKGQAVGNLRTYLTPRRVIQNIHQDDGEHATVPVADVDYDANPNSTWKTIGKCLRIKIGKGDLIIDIYAIFMFRRTSRHPNTNFSAVGKWNIKQEMHGARGVFKHL